MLATRMTSCCKRFKLLVQYSTPVVQPMYPTLSHAARHLGNCLIGFTLARFNRILCDFSENRMAERFGTSGSLSLLKLLQ